MHRHQRRLGSILFAVGTALAFGACGGGGSPAGPSAFPASFSDGISLDGTLLGGVSSSSFSAASVSAFSSGTITVTVLEDPTLTTTVDPSDGSFTLRGLPAGSFTLEFSHDSSVLGTIAFDSVQPNQELEVIVEITDTGVEVVQETRNGIGHGDVELEGDVAEVLTLDPAGESRFSIDGSVVVVRPGVTAIREGNRRRGVEHVTEGRRVHVKGVWLEPEGAEQPVLAHEIKLQGDAEDDDGGGSSGGKITICHIPPGNPSKKKTKTIDASAWPDHKAHGDRQGPC